MLWGKQNQAESFPIIHHSSKVKNPALTLRAQPIHLTMSRFLLQEPDVPSDCPFLRVCSGCEVAHEVPRILTVLGQMCPPGCHCTHREQVGVVTSSCVRSQEEGSKPERALIASPHCTLALASPNPLISISRDSPTPPPSAWQLRWLPCCPLHKDMSHIDEGFTLQDGLILTDYICDGPISN